MIKDTYTICHAVSDMEVVVVVVDDQVPSRHDLNDRPRKTHIAEAS